MAYIEQLSINLNVKIFILLALSMLLSGTAISKTISICDHGCDSASVTEGIYSADPGDTLEVHSGIYLENVDVRKRLILLGKNTGSGEPVIDADGNGSAITISADNVTVQGFNITNSLGSWLELWAGIEVNSNNNIIKNNLAFNNENGILITGSNNTIHANKALNNIYGIKTKDSANNSITDSDLRNNNYGLFLLASESNTIQQNLAVNNEFGFLLNESLGNNLSHNQMTGNSYNFGCHGENQVDTSNLADGKPIYYLVGLSNWEINSTRDPAVVCCVDCSNLVIKGLDLKNNLYGIYLENTSHAIVENNTFSNNRNAIAIANSFHNSIMGNQARDNIEGIVLTSSRYNTVQGNKVLKSQAGLHLVYSNYNDIIDNRFSQNDRGLWLYRSGQNLLSGNILISNSLGADLSYAWFNQLYNNNVSDNDQGILLYWSASNDLSANRVSNNSDGLLYDPLDNNTLAADNLIQNNVVNRKEIKTRSTAGPIKSSIAVFIISNPADALIINRDESIKTPGPTYFVDPGNYTVRIEKRGFKDKMLEIVIPREIPPDYFDKSMNVNHVDLIPEDNIERG